MKATIATLALLLTFGLCGAKAQSDIKGVNLYNTSANPQKDLALAVEKAKKEKKHVFVQIGGNWCIWCVRFHHLVDSVPELKSYMASNFETVMVNYSKENKNVDFMKKYGYPNRFGFPVFLIIDGDGKLLHIQNSAYLEEGKGHSAQKVLEFLKNWNYGALLPENNKL